MPRVVLWALEPGELAREESQELSEVGGACDVRVACQARLPFCPWP